jgi:hypothetical protein
MFSYPFTHSLFVRHARVAADSAEAFAGTDAIEDFLYEVIGEDVDAITTAAFSGGGLLHGRISAGLHSFAPLLAFYGVSQGFSTS